VRLLFRIWAFISYWLRAVDKHSLQSPFVYDLYTRVICPEKPSSTPELDDLRNQLLSDPTLLEIKDLGAGSCITNSPKRTVGHIVRHSMSSYKVSTLLARLISWNESKHILELGTSIGLNTLYMASYPAAKVVTFEGCPEVSSYATKLFSKQSGDNIRLIKGNIDQTLSSYLEQSPKPDLVYFDANHTEEATLRYFEAVLKRAHEHTVLVFDDIHWSPGMQRAWNNICKHPQVRLSMDLFHLGIVYINPELSRQHFVLWW
jgi:predicted O-methyltransferase YrrM